MSTDEKYMRRALELAALGQGYVSPNPMVGAVIVSPDGRVIGEGWHRRYGSWHAEVNAVSSVRPSDEHLLEHSTIYVTLEPCSHYGKTPPCAELLIRKRFRRVVVGAVDPFAKVRGRGIAMLRDAGIEVCTGVLESECRALNAHFFTAHENWRPYVTLKWAQSADGYIGLTGGSPVRLSTPLTSVLVHRQRALHDAILVGSGTMLSDHPRLDVRLWEGRNPKPLVWDRSGHLNQNDLSCTIEPVEVCRDASVSELLTRLYSSGITSLLVEGGEHVLTAFIASGIWDAARVEVATDVILAEKGGASAPRIEGVPTAVQHDGANSVLWYANRFRGRVKNL